ncbi:MAG: hypothetical protein ABSC92_17800 [Rhizomicrobium sp.]|jgi:hypothetical protein
MTTKTGGPPLQSAVENQPAAENTAAETPGNGDASAPEAGPCPRDYLMSVVQDPTASAARRDAAAKALMPYIHARVSPVAPVMEQDTAAQRRMKEASDSLIRKMAEFRAEEEGTIPEPADGSGN